MKKWVLTIVFAVFMLVLAACGGDNSAKGNEDNGSEGASSTVDLVASNWQFEKESYTVAAGDITFNLENKKGFHGISIEGTDVSIEGEGSATTNLDPGEYTIMCSIPCGEGHEEMEAQLIVE